MPYCSETRIAESGAASIHSRVRRADRLFPLLLAAALGAALVAGSAQAQEPARPPAAGAQVRFNIPEQRADGALNAFARQSGWRILFPYGEVEGKRTRAVVGTMTAGAALDALLQDTGLREVSRQDGVIILCPQREGGCGIPQQDAGREVADEVPAPPRVAEIIDMQKILVTPFRREIQLQDVPAAISVLRGEDIRALGAQDFRDYLSTVPGVNFTENNTGAMRVTIRGIGALGNDPLTGIYIDETPITESYFATLDPDVHDVERVEVLRGPQGTLYGSGSMGGTVRIITRRPELDWFEASIDATATNMAHGGWGRRVDGLVNVPLVDDRLAFRASAGYRSDDGWVDDEYRGETGVNDVETKNLRAQLLYQPSDETSVLLGFLYQGQDHGQANVQDPSLRPFRMSRAFGDFGGSDAALFSLTAEHRFGGATLTSASNYLGKDTFIAIDTGTTILPVVNTMMGVQLGPEEGVGVRNDTRFEQFTQELRLASPTGGRVDYVVGGFYSDATADVLQMFDFEQAPSAGSVESGGEFYTSARQYATRQIAAFGEVTFHANPRFSLTAGLRAFEFNQRNTNEASGTLNRGASTTVGDVTNASTQQKYLVEFRPTKQNLLYAQASQGYRNGGPTGDFPIAACEAALAELGYTTVPTSYGPDKLWNYELGSRNTLADGRVTLNGAAYYVDWTDIQLDARLGCGFGLVINAGQAVSRGFELETTAQPLPGLTLAAAVAYTDAQIRRSAPGVSAADGDPIPYVADWSWNASAHYRFPLPHGFDMFVRGEVNHVGNRWNDMRSVGPAALRLDSYTVAGMRIGISRGSWAAALFASNLFNERVVTQRTSGGLPIETVGRPFTIGVSTRFTF